MQQDPFLYSAQRSFPQDDTRVKFQTVGPYHVQQPCITPWSAHHVPHNIGGQINAYNNVDKNAMGHPANNIVTPVSTSVYSTTATFSWAHTVPTFMPWGPSGEEIPSDPLVRFTGSFPPDPCTSQTATSWELLNNLGANKSNLNVHLKRKSDLDAMEYGPQKQCVTEERMAARMKDLHISNHYCIPTENLPHGAALNSSPSEKSATNLRQLEEMLQESELSNNEAKSLILAPELKKLVAPEKLFASTFLDKVERPSMAVVVWQPQKNVIQRSFNSSDPPKAQEDEATLNCRSLPETNNNLIPQRLSNICSQHISFGSNMDHSLLQSSEFDKSSDVIMDT